MLPSLNALRAFEAAARHLSFKEAAAELNLTPSAVSRHIRALEEQLGIGLFERGFRQVTLTEKARFYAHRLSEAFHTLAEATEEARDYGPAQQRALARMTLSANSTFMTLWLADRLPEFRKKHPDVELEVSVHDDAGNGGNPRADVRIIFTDDGVAGPQLTRLISLVTVAVCAPSLMRGRRGLRKPADLQRARLLHENTTAWWEEWLLAEGLPLGAAKQGPIFHDPSLVIRAAVNGEGIALADNIMVEDCLVKGELVEPFKIRRRIANCYALVERRGVTTLSTVKKFRVWLVAAIETHKQTMRMG